MTDFSAHEKTPKGIIEAVWYAGTDAIKEGEGFCYNTDYGTAASIDGRRGNHVERPSLTNNYDFAGVAESDHSAKAGGQLIRIFTPGSKGVNVALGIDTVIGTGFLTFTAGASGSHRGRFVKAGFKGRGTIVPRQTVTALVEADWAGATWSLATDGVTLTVDDASDFTVGDTVVFVGSEVEDGGGNATVGKHIVSAVSTTAEEITLSASAMTGTAAAAIYCTGYAYTGNPKCQADLLTGEESGGIEFLSPHNAAEAPAPMVGGITYICGGGTLAGDNDAALAQGTFQGMLKGFYCLGTLTSNEMTVVLATSGVQLDGSSALVSVDGFNAVAEQWYGQYNGLRWRTIGFSGCTEE